ncbi:MAG: hypothetical protein WCG25_06540 [bacterium]
MILSSGSQFKTILPSRDSSHHIIAIIHSDFSFSIDVSILGLNFIHC